MFLGSFRSNIRKVLPILFRREYYKTQSISGFFSVAFTQNPISHWPGRGDEPISPWSPTSLQSPAPLYSLNCLKVKLNCPQIKGQMQHAQSIHKCQLGTTFLAGNTPRSAWCSCRIRTCLRKNTRLHFAQLFCFSISFIFFF